MENLQFPFEWVRPLLDEHDLGVTFDVGHLLTHGGDIERHLEEFGDRLTVVHLHGVADGRDHREIGSFDHDELVHILGCLAEAPTKRPPRTRASSVDAAPPVVVSLEVFGWKPTTASLRTLAEILGAPRGAPFAAAAEAVLELSAE